MMGVKHLDNYLLERKHIHTLPLSTLSDSRLGIDAAQYLSVLTAPYLPGSGQANLSAEPLLSATGGLPLALTTRIESDLRVLEKLKVKPVFVFSGLTPGKKSGKAGQQGYAAQQMQREWYEACAERQAAWEKYEQGIEDAATTLFGGGGQGPQTGFGGAGGWKEERQWDLWRMVLRIFRHRNVEFIVAPYSGWSQLVYLQRHSKSYVHAVYGSTETLLFPKGVDKLILSLDLHGSSPSFTYVTKQNILNDLGIDENMFLDVGILIGAGGGMGFPPTAHEQALKATVDMVKYYKSGVQAVVAFQEHPPTKAMGYSEWYARTKTMFRYALIFSSEGSVQPLPLALGLSADVPPGVRAAERPMTAADVPADLHEVFSSRLPDEMFFYMSRGLVTPTVLGWLTSGSIVEAPPLDNGETTEYKRFVKEVVTDGTTGPRSTGLALVAGCLGRDWARKGVHGMFWFDQVANQNPAKPIMYNSPQTAQLAERVGGWQVRYGIVEEELRRQNSSTIDFALCLGATATERLAARTKTKPDSGKSAILERKDEIVANVIWRFLELRGFLLATHTHSGLARAMHTSISHARLNDKFQDPLYLFLELVRAGVMHGHLWSGRAFSGGPSFGGVEEKESMLLVMRVLSLVPLGFMPVAWSAPLSRELLVFNSFVRSLTRALRTLLESTSLNVLLKGDARRARDDLLDITLSLPLQTDVNTGGGVLAKVYLDALTHLNGGQHLVTGQDGAEEMKGVALDICEETFTGVKNPRMEVERGFRFWDVALSAMRLLHSEAAVLQELIDQFEAAEAWLAPMRP